jgi:lipoate-protein ligase A
METRKWRLVTARTNGAELYAGYITLAAMGPNLGITPDTIAFFYIDELGVYLQRYCEANMDVDYEFCKKNNIPVVRGLAAAGGVGSGEPGVEPYVIMAWDPRRHPEIPSNIEAFYGRILSRISDGVVKRFKIPFRYRHLNDLEIWDPKIETWRKVSGVGTSSSGNAQFFAWFPIYSPATKPEIKAGIFAPATQKLSDKEIKEVAMRTWTFEEAGVPDKSGIRERDDYIKTFIDINLEAFEQAFGIKKSDLEEGGFTEEELKLVKENYARMSAEDWVLAKTADYKFKEIPEGTNLGSHWVKVTGGPLIRCYIVRREDAIEDILFTGTMHMYPADTLEEIEKELKGSNIDNAQIRDKVNAVWKRLNVELGAGSPELVSEAVIKACEAAKSS